MKNIQLKITPAECANGHQVRIFIDGQDLITILDKNSLGRDPVGFLEEKELIPSDRPFECIIAKCGCGCIGCSDKTVSITKKQNKIIWNNFSPTIPWEIGDTIEFDADQYQTEVYRALHDHSWETIERTTERKIRTLNFESLTQYHLTMMWASGRLYDDKISVSFWLDNGLYQVISSCPWNKKNPEHAVTAISEMIHIHPKDWRDVRYLPQQKNLKTPEIAGKGWRKDAH